MRRPPLLICTLWLLVSAVLPMFSQDGPGSEIRGVVTDLLGGKVAGAAVRFVRETNEYTVQTEEDGTYSIHLTPGSYTVSAYYLGFCPAERGNFDLKPNSALALDFELIPCAIHGPPFARAYEKEELPELGPPGRRPLLQYGYRGGSPAKHIGLVQQGVYVRPILTYDVWTLRANSIYYNQALHRVEGEGNVTWQDGTTTRTGTYIMIDFTDRLVVRSLR